MRHRILLRSRSTALFALATLAMGCVAGCSTDAGVGENNNLNNQVVLQCGNAEIEGLEECDDGSANSDITPNACRTDCTVARCGDSVVDDGEACDDGRQNADVVPDACRTDCTEPRCGDDVVDVQTGENCDDGNVIPGDGCSDLCRTEYCGNGTIDDVEQCDDGNLLAGDGCGPTCEIEGCGNGFVDPEEDCDDGNLAVGDGCSDQCRQEYCGNGILDPGELCDDGNQDFGDGCTPDCSSLESCANDYLDWATGETCDDGGLRSGDGCSSECEVEPPDWHPEAGHDAPAGPLYCTAMAYHAALRRTVLFGGSSNCDETWEYDGTVWDQVSPPIAPTSRTGANLVYDSRRQRIVLFGGDTTGDNHQNTTWEYDGNTWTQIYTANAPPGRAWFGMAYDAARGRVVIFGGECAPSNNCELNDTWEYDGTDWQEVTSAGSPGYRKATGMAYDPERERVVLFGGWHRTWTILALDDTWEYDGTTWVQAAPATVPPGNTHHTLTFDAARGQIVLFGYNNGETWVYDGRDWTLVLPSSTPGARSRHGAAYDVRRDRTVIFGGANNETWEYNGSQWELAAAPSAPQPLVDFAMTYDTVRHRTVLFGGATGWDNSDETWEHDGRGWQLMSPVTSPAPRYGSAMTYDVSRQRVVMTGGAGGSPPATLDTWEYDGTTWTQVMTANAPTNTHRHAMAYDVARDVVVLLTLDETWEYDGTDWTLLPAAGAPAGTNRTQHIMVYDEAHAQIVLFGGVSGASGNTFHNDTWVYDGTSWTQLATVSSPPARAKHATVYDPHRQTVLIHGGSIDSMSAMQDTWELDGTTWRQITTDHQPATRMEHALVYDRLRGRVMMFGGLAVVVPLGDTWHLLYGEPWNHQDCIYGTGDDDGDGLMGCADPDCDEECRACGDGTCDTWETRGLCPADCGELAPVCGDFRCDAVESCVNCRSDCPTCPTEADCYDGADNDGDGLLDCADPDCVGCVGAACTSGADCHSGLCAASVCTAPQLDCDALLTAAPTTPDGAYFLDPDGPGAAPAFQTWCDMTTDGGGWTLALVSSDDGRPSWTWSRRTLLTSDSVRVGYPGAWKWSFKSPAHHTVTFTDLLFVHEPSGTWAAYHSVGSGVTDVGSYMATLPYPNCSLATGHPLSAGTLAVGGSLCDTNLYFHNGDEDGGALGANCLDPTRNYYNGTYGPVWNAANNGGCDFDDPSSSSLGPNTYSPAHQAAGVGFGHPLGLNTGRPGVGDNSIRMFVR